MKLKEIEGLIDFIAKSGLEEVHIETESSIALQGSGAFSATAIPQLVSKTESQPVIAPDVLSNAGTITVKSPMIGTFYRSSKPEDPPFVQEGDTVTPGQIICIIEAMKLFNEIEAEVAGTIVKILVEDASPVEYDQPLFLIKPA